MCWSPSVTLAFVALELACCAGLVACGLRGLLLGFGPLVLQELVQLLLWWHTEADGAAACDASNTVLSFAQLGVVCGLVPVGFALQSIRSLDQWRAAVAEVLSSEAGASPEAERTLSGAVRGLGRDRRRLRMLAAASAGLATFEACYAAWGVGAGWWRPFCTTRGPMGGHQLWPWMQTRLPPSVRTEAGEKVLRVVVWLCYLLLVFAGVACFRGESVVDSAGLAFRRGRIAQVVLVLCTPAFLPPLWLLWGAEFGSIWCWGASASMITTFAEPALAAWAHGCHRRQQAGSVQDGRAAALGAQLWREMLMPPRNLLEAESRQLLVKVNGGCAIEQQTVQ